MNDMEENNFVFNKYQTALTDDILKTLDSSSQSELFDCITKIELIKNLSNKDRKYAKDLERINGKIVVNLENPHILENMQYFKPAARHFQQFGCYTKLLENPDPDSDYMKFWTEERRRCLEGYVRESDGEWIPGYLYHYWNYGRVKVKIKTSAKTAIEKEDFPNIYDSDYWYFHYIDQAQSNGLFGFSLKKRRWGYSYKLQNMMCRNYVHIKGSKSFVLASGKEYIYRDGPMPKFKQNLSFIEENTPFWSPRLIDTMEHTKSGYKDKKLGIEKGRFSEVMGVTCKDDPDKGRGKAGVLVAFEEVGIFPQLEKTWTVAEESVRQDDLVYGFLNGSGTGGSDGSNFESAEKMFYSPEGYNIKPMRNIYSKTNGVGICSFFVPTYVSYEGAYDENGNSDVIKAMVSLLEERQKIKNSTHDSNRLLQKKAEKPITPEEAVLRKEGSIFPILDIKEYLSTIYPNRQSFVSGHYTGNLVLKPDNSVVLEHVEGNTPIRKYPLNSESDKTGSIEIFELPKKVNHGDRYILGVDPIENDEVKYSVSLGSVFVFDRYTKRIVAEYTGRPNSVDEFFEICYRLAVFYDGKIMYENNKKGMYGYFLHVKNAVHILADNPEYLKDTQSFKPKSVSGNTSKGFTSTVETKRHGRMLQSKWMMETAYEAIPEMEYDDNGNPLPKKNEINLHKIRSIAYLEECSQWNPDGNFDRVDAMTCVMIYDQELGKVDENIYSQRSSKYADNQFLNKFKLRGNGIMSRFGYKVNSNYTG